MVFTTQIFLFAFLPLALTLYYLSTKSIRTMVLCAASVVFYGWWRPDFVALMLFSSAVDYFLGRRIYHLKDRKRASRLVVTSCVVNLALLGYFKYANFGIDTLNNILASFGHERISWTSVVLPVGISFYTFQSMSYSIDIYRKQAQPVDSALDFFCYVSLFPQLVAGPIVRFRELADQLRHREHSFTKFSSGVFLFQIGLAKKVLIADLLAGSADEMFAMANPSFGDAWIGVTAYTFQIYFDFSGYSDMAMGLGMMFGFIFPINFASPYRSVSITDFWRRWHISLSSWLRDYLYIPLGGNKKGPFLTYVFLATTMLLGGLWHGASWTFIAWGAYQGLWLIVERLNGKKPLHAGLPHVFQILITFIIAMGGWVFFRAQDLGQALEILVAMTGMGEANASAISLGRLEVMAFLIASLIAFFGRQSYDLVKNPGWALSACVSAWFFLCVGEIYFQSFRPFLYFQF